VATPGGKTREVIHILVVIIVYTVMEVYGDVDLLIPFDHSLRSGVTNYAVKRNKEGSQSTGGDTTVIGENVNPEQSLHLT
jgi:hypothetical protein